MLIQDLHWKIYIVRLTLKHLQNSLNNHFEQFASETAEEGSDLIGRKTFSFFLNTLVTKLNEKEYD